MPGSNRSLRCLFLLLALACLPWQPARADTQGCTVPHTLPARIVANPGVGHTSGHWGSESCTCTHPGNTEY
jgi:hypothetical protein